MWTNDFILSTWILGTNYKIVLSSFMEPRAVIERLMDEVGGACKPILLSVAYVSEDEFFHLVNLDYADIIMEN